MSHPTSAADVKMYLPEATTVGVLGSGQLGRMLAIAARRMGYRVHIYASRPDSPAGMVADAEIVAEFDDSEALVEFVRGVNVVTVEFENVPAASLALLESHVPVRPGAHVLETTQHRLREKSALKLAGFPVTDFVAVTSLDELREVAPSRLPAILKTAAWGYDGKGQSRIDSMDDVDEAWAALQCDDAILESFVDFECELSVVAVRSANGEMACYEPFRNDHENHILDISVCPADLPAELARRAKELATAILSQLNVVGVMCVEMFLTNDQQLIVNELAPRPHNSGHLTIDAHATCQFEQQLRALCGLPLGSTEQLSPAAMANLLGDLWIPQMPDWSKALGHPGTKLHLYGKQPAEPGRKMGHLTSLAKSVGEAKQQVEAARNSLKVGSEAEVL